MLFSFGLVVLFDCIWMFVLICLINCLRFRCLVLIVLCCLNGFVGFWFACYDVTLLKGLRYLDVVLFG